MGKGIVFLNLSGVKREFKTSNCLSLFLLITSTICLSGFTFLRASANEVITIRNNSQTLSFTTPVNTIITLAPHATELTYSAGAGEKITGTVKHSDYPDNAKSITRVGDAHRINLEKIIALNPDLIIAWTSGNNPKELAKLHNLGFKIYYSDATNFQDIAKDIKNIGRIAGTDIISEEAAEQFIAQINNLYNTYNSKSAVSVFYQLWHAPLMTINKSHFINQSISLCGGINVFTNSPVQVPQVNIEAILETKPKVVIAAYKNSSQALAWVHALPKALAFTSHLATIDPDLLHRPTLRLAEGTEKLCKILQSYRDQS